MSWAKCSRSTGSISPTCSAKWRTSQGVEWYKAQQLGDTYWLYVVWDPLDAPDPVPLMVQNPARYLDYAKKEVVTARYYDLPTNAVEQAAREQWQKQP